MIVRMLALGAMLLPMPAQAQTLCGPYNVVVRKLENQYRETRRAVGEASNGAVMELFASEETGTWTILLTFSETNACLIAAGGNFLEAPPMPAGDPI